MSTIIKENITKQAPLRPKARVIEERCVGCQECFIRCPVQAISIDTAGWKAIVDNDLCTGCRLCERACAFSAILVNAPGKAVRASTGHQASN